MGVLGPNTPFLDGRMTDDIDALWTGTNFDEVEAATADFDFE